MGTFNRDDLRKGRNCATGGPIRPVFEHHSFNTEKPDYKTAALCKQVRRAIALGLAGECADPVLQSLVVNDVLPAPNAGRLLVRMMAPAIHDYSGVADILARLEKVHGLLRRGLRNRSRENVRRKFPSTSCRRASHLAPKPARCRMENDVPLMFFLAGPLPKGVAEAIDRLRRTEGVAQIAVMPDVHLAAEFCVGAVVASREWLYPGAVGGDIGCGMLAMRFDGDASVIDCPERAQRLLGALMEKCPSRRHKRGAAPSMDRVLTDLPLSDRRLIEQFTGEASRGQMGTLGAGNHFLELQSANDGGLWLMIHTGSRHFGQVIHQHHLMRARKLATNVMAIPADTAAGFAYLNDVAFGRAWAKENRRQLALAASAQWKRS